MAGHILGAASVHVSWAGRSLLFSGDLGRDEDLLMRPPQAPPAADCVVVESTYGDRTHEDGGVATQLAEAVNRTAARGGIVVVPAFAVGRAQASLYLLANLKKEHRIPDLPLFLNSPMAADVTGIYHHHAGEHRLNAAQCERMCHAATVSPAAQRWQRGRRRSRSMAPTCPWAPKWSAWVRCPRTPTGASCCAGSESCRTPPRRVFVTLGEPVAADALRQAIEERHRWPCTVPDHMQRVEL